MTKILFVCHGNICRSPMAEYIMKDMARRAGLEREYGIASAAVSREELGNPVYPPAAQKLAEHGIACAGHRARQMTKDDYALYDLIVCMDKTNVRNALRITGGDPEGKMSLLLDHAGRPGDEVADPWYTGDFEKAWGDVAAGCEGLLEKTKGGRGKHGGA
ncbi:MAG: low molecular weight phosphotyrosine protein phosphatase [Mailhella sp.]|nr:low molecular weight phosphotyrosine protein phosphatase [Mailhella sp.]